MYCFIPRKALGLATAPEHQDHIQRIHDTKAKRPTYWTQKPKSLAALSRSQNHQLQGGDPKLNKERLSCLGTPMDCVGLRVVGTEDFARLSLICLPLMPSVQRDNLIPRVSMRILGLPGAPGAPSAHSLVT